MPALSAVEHRFPLQHKSVGAMWDAAVSSVGLAIYAAKLVTLGLGWAADELAPVFWVHTCGFIADLLAIVLLGSKRYTLVRGPFTIWLIAIFIVGMGFNVKPDGLCFRQFLWQHRLFLCMFGSAMGRVPAFWIWAGAPIHWWVAVVIDFADKHQMCSHPVYCAAQAFCQLLANPTALAGQVTSQSSMLYLGDVLLGGLAATYMERAVRKAWLHQLTAGTARGALNHGSQLSIDGNEVLPAKQQCHAASSSSNSTCAVRHVSSASDKSGQDISAARAAVQHAIVVPAALHAAATAVSAATAAGIDLGALTIGPQQTGCALYQSPLRRKFVSIKLHAPSCAGWNQLQEVSDLVSGALQAALAPSSNNGTAAAPPATTEAPVIIHSVAFRGCYQLLFEIVTPCQQATAAVGSQQHPDDADIPAIEREFQQRLPAGWRLLNVQHHIDSTAPALATAPDADDDADANVRVISATGPVARAAGLAAGNNNEEDIMFEPMVVALPVQQVTPPGPSSGIMDGADGVPQPIIKVNATVQLPHHRVQQLLQANLGSVRVVIAERPMGAVLLDQTWQLQHPDTTTRAAMAGIQLSASLDVGSSGRTQQSRHGKVQVLSTVVLAGAGVSNTSDRVEAQQLKPAAEEAAAAATVLAHLPLLLLPAGAHKELQQLVETAVAGGMQQQEAQQQLLLPLVQDWAALVLLWDSVACWNTLWQHGVNAAAVADPLYESLSRYFDEEGLLGCYKLLACSKPVISFSNRCSMQALATTATATSAGCSTGPNKTPEQQKVPVMKGEAVTNGCSSSTSSGADGLLPCAADAVNLPTSGSTDRGRGGSSTKRDNSKLSDGASCSSACIAPGQVHLQSGGPAVALPPAACKLGIRTLLVGFPHSAVEDAYSRWKGVTLQRHDLFVATWHALSLTAMLGKLLLLAMSRHGSSSQQLQVLVTALNAAFIVMFIVPHVSLWLVCSKWQNFTAAGRWRGVLLVGWHLSLFVAAGGCLYWPRHSLLGTAMTDTVRAHNAPLLLLLTYRHLLLPAVWCVGVLPAVVFALYVTLVVDRQFNIPHIAWLGPVGTATVFGTGNILLAGLLDHNMRRSFIRDLRAS